MEPVVELPRFFVALKNTRLSKKVIIDKKETGYIGEFCLDYFINERFEFHIKSTTPIETTGLIDSVTGELLSKPIAPNEFLTLTGRSSISKGFAPEELIFLLQNNSNITILNDYDELWNINIPRDRDFIVAPIYIPKKINSDNSTKHYAHFVTAIISGDQENRKVQILDTSRAENEGELRDVVDQEEELGNGINYEEELQPPEGKQFDFISNEYCNQGDRSTCGFFTMSACEIATQYSDYESLNKAFEDNTFQKKVTEDVNEKLKEISGLSSYDSLQIQEISQEEGKVKQGGQASSPLSLIKTLYPNSENENSEAKTSEVKKSETSFSPEKLPNIENKTEEQVEGSQSVLE